MQAFADASPLSFQARVEHGRVYAAVKSRCPACGGVSARDGVPVAAAGVGGVLRGWAFAYAAVCGVVHTDYMQYARSEGLLGGAAEAVTWAFQNLAYRAHCDVLVSLSKAVGADSGAPSAIAVVENCHGVRDDFLDVGRRVLRRRREQQRQR